MDGVRDKCQIIFKKLTEGFLRICSVFLKSIASNSIPNYIKIVRHSRVDLWNPKNSAILERMTDFLISMHKTVLRHSQSG